MFSSPLDSSARAAGLIGREAFEDMWPARAAIDAGEIVAFASDWNVAPLNPWPAIQYLVTRENPDFPEMGKFAPQNTITVEEAINGYTINAAYAINMDDVAGSITVGKSADMTVLDHDIFTTPADQLAETRVLQTVFRGNVVYDQGSSN